MAIKVSGTEIISDARQLKNIASVDGTTAALLESVLLNIDAATLNGFSSTDFATSAQGTLADSALQPSDIGTSVQGYSAVLAGTTASFTTADETKLDGIEAGATADQTGAEIKALYEAQADTNAYTDAEKSKLTGIEAGATADQTGSEIKALYEAQANTNAYTDAEKSKLVGIEAGATADQTKADIDALGIDAATLGGNNSAYFTGYTDTAVANLVASAPTTLDTLNELAAALGDDPNFATTVSTQIGTKVSKSGDTMTGNLTVPNLVTAGLVDGRDVSVDGAKLDGIEAGADVTDSTNVSAAGALMKSGGTMSGAITLPDNVRLYVGSGNDLEVYHSSNNTFLQENNTTGGLVIRASNLTLGSSTGEPYLIGRDNGATELYYDNSLKLATSSSGATIVGSLGVNSNITVGGTVDGRDVAADGSKLDGIEAGATADQTITAGAGLTGGGTGNVTLSHADTSAQASVNNSGATVIQDVTLDTYGHVTGLGSATITPATIGAATAAQGALADSAIQPNDNADLGNLSLTGTISGSATFFDIANGNFGRVRLSAGGVPAVEARYLDGPDGSYGLLNYAGSTKIEATSAGGQVNGNWFVNNGSIDVEGNITLTGTVDGRDIAKNIPATFGTAGQVLTVNGTATGTQWTTPSSGIANVVEDTTPQLGGNLDLNSKNVSGTGNIAISGELEGTWLRANSGITAYGPSYFYDEIYGDFGASLRLRAGDLSFGAAGFGWDVHFDEAGTGKLIFSYQGVNKMSIDTSGNLICSGDVTAFGTP